MIVKRFVSSSPRSGPDGRNASNVIGCMQPGAFADQGFEIGCIDTDCLNAFGLKIVMPSWISRQDNWTKAKLQSCLDV